MQHTYGNDTFYLTTYIRNTANPLWLPDVGAGASDSTNSSFMQPNALYLSASNPSSLQAEEISLLNVAHQWTVQIEIPVAISSAGEWKNSNVPRDPPLDYSIYPYYTHESVQTQGFAQSSLDVQVNTSLNANSGINVTGPNYKGETVTQAQENFLIDGFGLIPKVGSLAGGYRVVQDMVALSGVYDNNPGVTGNGSVYENFRLNDTTQTNGIWSVPLESVDGGYDVFGSLMLVYETIPIEDFSTGGTITIGGANYYQHDALGNVYEGANASIVIPALPAYTIQGYINSNGNPAANQEIMLASSSGNNYILHTDSNGYYRFFSNPSSTYKLEVPSSSYGAQTVPPADGSTGGTWANLSLNSITFSKTSNVYGETWSATLTGPGGSESASTSGSSITFDVFGNTSYSYSIGDPTGYSASPSIGDINLGTTSYTQSISFSPTVTYSATFSESGLPSGQTWSVKLDGNSKSASAGSSISFTVSDGSHSFSIPYDYYSTTLWYEPSPGSGSFSIPYNGRGYSFSTTFIAVQQNPNSCVYALAPVLLSNYTREYAENVSIGDSVMTYNFTSNQREPGTVEAVFITQHSEIYVINGYLKVAGDQDIWTNHGYIQAQNLTSNDTIFDIFNHHYYEVHSISIELGTFTMYDFYVSANHNYVVWSNLMEDRLP